MKKLILWVLVCMLSLVGCGTNKIDYTQPVFATENIKSVTLYSMPDFEDGITVPSEDMEEIIAWIDTFRIDKVAGKAGDKLDPGTGIRVFQIEYLDGTCVESDAITIERDGMVYYMTKDREPQCYHDLFANKRAEKEARSAMTCKNLEAACAEGFTDPSKVTVLGGEWAYTADPEKFVVLAEIEATDKFGEYEMFEMVMVGTFGGEIELYHILNEHSPYTRENALQEFGAIDSRRFPLE